ncbi:hypothetical protein BX666DRAFT_1999749 [Dichotomocladium elegans]|nr:hypothetical protein BX666DRAFT_1999749 [Dichotomocladium elegans]
MSHDYGFTDSFTPLLPPHEKQKKKKKKKKKSKEKKTHNEQQCPDPTFEPPAFSIPDKNSELSIPRPKKAKTTPNSADASSLQHQQTRTHDTAAASDRKRWSGSLMSSDNVSLAQVQLTDIPGYSRNADDLHHFIKSCEQQAGRGMMIVSAYLNVRILCAFLDLAVSLFQVKPVEQTSMVAYGKLRNFLNVNGVVKYLLLDKQCSTCSHHGRAILCSLHTSVQ